jgi:hypothetical protein
LQKGLKVEPVKNYFVATSKLRCHHFMACTWTCTWIASLCWATQKTAEPGGALFIVVPNYTSADASHYRLTGQRCAKALLSFHRPEKLLSLHQLGSILHIADVVRQFLCGHAQWKYKKGNIIAALFRSNIQIKQPWP